jgi:hypothetical protein
MKRSILSFIVGLVVWVLVASLLNRVLRLALKGYAAAEPQMVFTHGMMAARLALGALASLAAGAATRAVAPSSARVLVGARRSPGRGIRPEYTSSFGRDFQCGITLCS